MIKNDDLRTSPKQRLIIIIIAAFMMISTFALYAGLVLNYGSNSNTENNLTSEEQARYNQLMAEYNDKAAKQADELSKKYFDTFKSYKGQVKAFNKASVDNLKTEDLKKGSGKEVTSTDFTDYAAYYIGWLSDETVFDSSFDDFSKPTTLKAPLAGTTGLIEGWKQGIKGMKIGGVRVVTIPSALGYGSQDQGTIPANSPLKFVIMLVDKPAEIEMSEELINLYYKAQGMTITPTETSTKEDTTKEDTKEAETKK